MQYSGNIAKLTTFSTYCALYGTLMGALTIETARIRFLKFVFTISTR